LSQLKLRGRIPGSPIVIKTEVTTGLITCIARHFGCQVVDNLLVGFKYIADVLWHLEQSGAYEDVRGTPKDFVIGGEESHGILVAPEIRDKDAAGGALLMAELALDQKRKGKTVLDYLEAIYRQFGYFRNDIVPVVMPGIQGKQNMARMLDQLRKTPLKEIGGLPVTDFEDLRDENGRMGPIKGATDSASRNVLIFRLGDRGRVALRPSGTEPKAKAYIEVCSPPCPGGASQDHWRKICSDVDSLSKRISEDFLKKVMDLPGTEQK
jgi:phosphoglucomutase/phosphomannomutase